VVVVMVDRWVGAMKERNRIQWVLRESLLEGATELKHEKSLFKLFPRRRRGVELKSRIYQS